MKKYAFLGRASIWGPLFLFLLIAGPVAWIDQSAHGQGPGVKQGLLWPPAGQKLTLPVVRDTFVSAVGKEKTGNNGGQSRLKVKGNQEYTLLDIDASPLKGKLITGALLHCRSAEPRKAPLARLGVSTVAAPWTEGTSRNYRPRKGASCFAQAEHGVRDWAYPGSTVMDVAFGRGHTIWKFADCTPPDRDGWQTCAVDPDVVAAASAGLSQGFLVYDEVGNIWSIKNGNFQFTYFPNRFFFSRESGKHAPWFEIWTHGEDSIPPEPVTSIRAETQGFPAGEALVSWKTPPDFGGGKTLGFQVSYQRQAEPEKAFPGYLVPMAGKAGERVKMHIQDLPFEPGEALSLVIRPVDSAGNVGPSRTRKILLSANPRVAEIPRAGVAPFPPDEALPKVGRLKVGVVDLLDKIDPKSGQSVSQREKGYKTGNHIFSARQKTVRLHAARNESVAFQLVLEGQSNNISISYDYKHHPLLKPTIHQFGYVNQVDKDGRERAVLPDPLIQLEGAVSIPSTSGRVRIEGQTHHCLVCELYVPHDEPPGMKKGRVLVSEGGESMVLDVELTVWNFTLPDKLSFIPEMNAYSTQPLYKDHGYYRLAHEHRACLNWLPYGWNGKPAFAPEPKGKGFDWKAWDEKIGPLVDGSAFADLPRKNEPVDVFYLPLSENWPVDLYDHFTPSYWAEEAFDSEYAGKFQGAVEAFARHIDARGWRDTIFQFYLNNKVYYRKQFNRSSAPWIFDEPVNTQDFWALRWYGLLWKQAVHRAGGNATLWYRGDISYSQFGRNILWGVMDVAYLGGNDPQKTRMKQDRQVLFGESHFSEYGSANKLEDSNAQPALWCLSAWSRGAMGVLPWQTIGGKTCWEIGEQTALFYPHPDGPKPSVRLKAFTRGQQDVEYLTLFCDVFQTPRYAVAAWLKQQLDLEGEVRRDGADDAGTAIFEGATPQALWKIRVALGEKLSRAAPPYRRSLVNRKTPEWDPGRLPDIGYVRVAPKVESYKPECDDFRSR